MVEARISRNLYELHGAMEEQVHVENQREDNSNIEIKAHTEIKEGENLYTLSQEDIFFAVWGCRKKVQQVMDLIHIVDQDRRVPTLEEVNKVLDTICLERFQVGKKVANAIYEAGGSEVMLNVLGNAEQWFTFYSGGVLPSQAQELTEDVSKPPYAVLAAE